MYVQTLDNKHWYYVKEFFVGSVKGGNYCGFAQTSNGYFPVTKAFATERTAERHLKEAIGGGIIREVDNDF